MSEATIEVGIALMIGNSRLHWALFDHSTLQRTWDTPHLSTEAVACLMKHRFDFNRCFLSDKVSPPTSEAIAAAFDRGNETIAPPPALWLASVVPAQAQLWQRYPAVHLLTPDRIPLGHLYPTLGIDRALALWGAASTVGLPALVIDAGTALTLTGADADANLIGGAILPGLGLQLRSLTHHTAALPPVTDRLNAQMSLGALSRWATNTPDAMLSGVIYSLLAGLHDFVQAWRQDYPTSAIVLTGGDGQRLFHYWQQQHPDIGSFASVDPHLVFWGIQAVVRKW